MKTRRINRREFLKLTGAMSSAAILAACAPQATGKTVATPTPSGATKVSLEIMTPGDENDDVHKAAFTLFRDLHPEIDLNLSLVPGGWPEHLAKVNTRVAAGNPPDMIQVATYGPEITWAKKKLMVDLKNYTSSDQDWKKNPLPEKTLNPYTAGGVLYGVPNGFVTHAVIYNKTLLDQAGVEAPKDGWTWADVVDKAQKLTSGTGTDKVFGWVSRTTQWWYEVYMLANDGPGFFDRRKWDFTKPTADNPKNAEALQWLYDTINKYKISPSPEDLQSQDSGTRQLSGKLAMWHGTTIDTVALLKNQDKIDWHVVPLPRAYPNGPSTTMNWTSGYGIFTSSKYPDKAWEFCKFFAIGEGAKLLGSTGFAIPPGHPEGFLSPDMVARGGQVFVDATNYDIVTNDSLGEYHDQILTQVISPTSEAFFLGKVTASDMMKQIQKGMEDILAANPA